MAETGKMRFRKGDWIAIAAVLLLAVFVALCFLPRSRLESSLAEIYQNGEKIKTLSLDEAQTFFVEGMYTNEVTVENGKIAITHSDCPGGDCVRSGSIKAPGRSIVCLPNKVEIRIVGQGDDVDFVVG